MSKETFYPEVDILETNFSDNDKSLCILCGESGGTYLHKASTFGLDHKVRKCAHICGDKDLIAKLSAGDLIAIDGVYHLTCLTKLYRKCDAIENEIDTNDNIFIRTVTAQAFSDLVEYVEAERDSDKPFLNMSELSNLYLSSLVSLGVKKEYIHSTRLRKFLLLAIPDLREVNRGVGKCVDVAFDENVTIALDMLADQNISDEMRDLCKAAKIMRKYIFATKNNFSGSLTQASVNHYVHPMVTAFLHMTLYGLSIEKSTESPKGVSKAVLSISQLIHFNAVKKRSDISSITRYIRDRETPFISYLHCNEAVDTDTQREHYSKTTYTRSVYFIQETKNYF